MKKTINVDAEFAAALDALADARSHIARAAAEFQRDMAQIIGEPAEQDAGRLDLQRTLGIQLGIQVRLLEGMRRDTVTLRRVAAHISAVNADKQRFRVSPEGRAHMSAGQRRRFADPGEYARHLEQLRYARSRRQEVAR